MFIIYKMLKVECGYTNRLVEVIEQRMTIPHVNCQAEERVANRHHRPSEDRLSNASSAATIVLPVTPPTPQTVVKASVHAARALGQQQQRVSSETIRSELPLLQFSSSGSEEVIYENVSPPVARRTRSHLNTTEF